MTAKILIVDDHPLVCSALTHLASNFVNNEEIAVAPTAENGLSIIKQHPALKLILVDIGLPGIRGAEAIAAYTKQCPSAHVVAISGSENRRDIAAALKAGAKAFISKAAPAATLSKLIEDALSDTPFKTTTTTTTTLHTVIDEANSHGLTKQQQKVLHLLCQGCRNKDIALTLKVAEITVKMHISSIFKVLNVSNRTEAVLMAQQLGIYSGKPQGE